MTAREREARLLSDDRLGALRDYYLHQEDGRGNYEDIFAHIEVLERRRAELDEERQVLAMQLETEGRVAAGYVEQLVQLKDALRCYRAFDDVIAALSDARREAFRELEIARAGLASQDSEAANG